MKILLAIAVITIVGVSGFFAFNNYIYNGKQAAAPTPEEKSDVLVTPISHATMVLQWNGKTIYTDPVGGQEAFAGQPDPDLVLITDIHGDHLNVDTLTAVVTANTIIIAPPAVVDLFPDNLKNQTKILANNEVVRYEFFDIQAIPMYNVPESADARHIKGRGNGYVIESEGTRVYIAGDTSATPEMRALEDIDIAFIPMNAPFTMTVEEAAGGVLAFKPRKVYPFHYRGQEGLADVNAFRSLVQDGDQSIEVVLLNWYPEN